MVRFWIHQALLWALYICELWSYSAILGHPSLVLGFHWQKSQDRCTSDSRNTLATFIIKVDLVDNSSHLKTAILNHTIIYFYEVLSIYCQWMNNWYLILKIIHIDSHRSLSLYESTMTSSDQSAGRRRSWKVVFARTCQAAEVKTNRSNFRSGFSKIGKLFSIEPHTRCYLRLIHFKLGYQSERQAVGHGRQSQMGNSESSWPALDWVNRARCVTTENQGKIRKWP